MTDRLSGTVEFFNNVKGWGVISAENESFFCHHSQITDGKFFPEGKPRKFRTLKAGMKVSFIPGEIREGKDDYYMKTANKVEINESD